MVRITDEQWAALGRLAEADRAADTAAQTWQPTTGETAEAVRGLEEIGPCRAVPASEVLRARTVRPPEARAARITPEGLDVPAWHHHRTEADRP